MAPSPQLGELWHVSAALAWRQALWLPVGCALLPVLLRHRCAALGGLGLGLVLGRELARLGGVDGWGLLGLSAGALLVAAPGEL